MGTRPRSSRTGGAGCRRAALAAALVLALGAAGAQAGEPAEGTAVGGVVGTQAVTPTPAPAPPPVAGAAAARTHAAHATAGGASASDATPSPAAQTTPQARAAAAQGATISGFAFQPGSITVTAGDAISWTNEDAASHTATADDGSFDTGTLAKGASGSHTFTTAGTFAYHCTIHPSMHGTVTVVAAASGGGSGTGSSDGGGTTTPPPTPSAAPAPATLPRTGWEPGGMAAAGAALLLAGFALRLRTRPR